MATFEAILAAEYGHLPEVDTRVSELFKDALCWCRQEKLWPGWVFPTGWVSAGFKLPIETIGMALVMNHPSHNDPAGQAEPEPEEDDPTGRYRRFEEAAIAGAERFSRILAQLSGSRRETADKELAENAVRLCCLTLKKKRRIVEALQTSVDRFLTMGGSGGVIAPDQFYERGELTEFFDEEGMTELLQFLGHGPDADLLISGADISRWLQTKRD